MYIEKCGQITRWIQILDFKVKKRMKYQSSAEMILYNYII